MSGTVLRVAVEPADQGAGLRPAVVAGGGEIVGVEAADVVVWADPNDASGLAAVLEDHDNLRWVQLPWAGVEPYVEVIRAHAERIWTCGKGVYAEPVAEHALALALAGRRYLDHFAKARSWGRRRASNLLGARVTILGGGGIAESLLRLLGPFGGEVTVVRATPQPMAGAARVLAAPDTDTAVADADVLVLALALTPDTEGVVDKRRLGLLAPGAVLVNVARGRHVVTEDLIPALDDGPLAHAGLDVTDPEPLPEDHPLWARPDVIITPHTTTTPEMAQPLLAARVTDNVRRYIAGEPLVGPVDPTKGY